MAFTKDELAAALGHYDRHCRDTLGVSGDEQRARIRRFVGLEPEPSPAREVGTSAQDGRQT